MKLTLFDSDKQFIFGIIVHYNSDFDWLIKKEELFNWCKQEFGREFTSFLNAFYFKTEEQRNWFILRWS